MHFVRTSLPPSPPLGGGISDQIRENRWIEISVSQAARSGNDDGGGGGGGGGGSRADGP